MASLKDIYDRRTPALERARDQLQSILVKVVAAIEDRALVRAEVRSVRIKGLSSIERKAAAKRSRADEALFGVQRSDRRACRLQQYSTEQIAMWATTWPDASNPGILTKFCPMINIDILDQGAAEAVEELARERFGES